MSMRATPRQPKTRKVRSAVSRARAMASALREGKMGVLDYYQMKNTIADTEMREGIARASAPQPAPTEE